MLTLAEAHRQHYRRLGEMVPLQRVPVSVSDYRDHMLARLAEFGITITWHRGKRAWAYSTQNHIVGPPMDNEDDVAVIAHEAGHVLAEQCRGLPHRPDPKVTSWHHCVRCELLAWANAIVLIRPLPWTPKMHRENGQLFAELSQVHADGC